MRKFARSFVRLTRGYSSSAGSSGSNYSKFLYLGIGAVSAVSANYYYTSTRPRNSITQLNEVSPFKYAEGDKLLQGFKQIELILGKENVSYTPSELDLHSDSFFNVHKPKPTEKPKLVVYPKDTLEVSEVLKVCNQYKIPVVPFSGGTSLEGNYISTRSGIVIDFSRLNKIISLNVKDLDVVVQAGVGWQDLDEYLRPYNLLFGPDPGPGARIGGMVATLCSGTQAFRYGTMKENVLNLTVVLADGTILKTKQRSKKSAAGYNLTGLFIGAEGTLGVVTEATLKLNPRPLFESVAMVTFKDIKQATQTVEKLLQSGTGQLNAIELMDTSMIQCINDSGQTSQTFKEAPTLLLKIGGGTTKILSENINLVKAVSKDFDSIDFKFASTDQDKEELWQARKLVLFSSIDYGRKVVAPDAKVWVTDVAVPVSKLSQLITESKDQLDSLDGVFNTVLGHVGDGNFHSVIVYKAEDTERVTKVVDDIVYKALEFEGTCTGEHGVGLGKRHFLEKEVGENSIALMRQLKLSLDPYGLLNVDKVFKIDPTDTDL